MKISVIIPCYNSGPELDSAVESALGQTVRPYEIVLLDDGSTNDTWQRLEGLRSRYGDVIRIFRRPENIGMGMRLELVRHSRGDWIAPLDHDDLWDSRKLEKQIQAHERYPRAGLIHTDGWNQPGDDRAQRALQDGPNYRGPANAYEAVFFGNFILQSSTFFGRAPYLELRNAADSVARKGADYELWLTMARSGLQFVRVPEPLMTRRVLPTGMLTTQTLRWLQFIVELFEREESLNLQSPRIKPRHARRRVICAGLELIHELLVSTEPAHHEEAAGHWIDLLRNGREMNEHRHSIIRLIALARGKSPRLGAAAGYPKGPWRAVRLEEKEKRLLLEEWSDALRNPGHLEKLAVETGRIFRQGDLNPPLVRMYEAENARRLRMMQRAWRRLEKTDGRWGWLNRL